MEKIPAELIKLIIYKSLVSSHKMNKDKITSKQVQTSDEEPMFCSTFTQVKPKDKTAILTSAKTTFNRLALAYDKLRKKILSDGRVKFLKTQRTKAPTNNQSVTSISDPSTDRKSVV